jgi:hypothetical protein
MDQHAKEEDAAKNRMLAAKRAKQLAKEAKEKWSRNYDDGHVGRSMDTHKRKAFQQEMRWNQKLGLDSLSKPLSSYIGEKNAR